MTSEGEDYDSILPTDGLAVCSSNPTQVGFSAFGSGWLAQPYHDEALLLEDSSSLRFDQMERQAAGSTQIQAADHQELQAASTVQVSLAELQEPSPPQLGAARRAEGGTGRRKKRGRPPKSKVKQPLILTEPRIEALLRLRYTELRDCFNSGKSNQQIRESWKLLTTSPRMPAKSRTHSYPWLQHSHDSYQTMPKSIVQRQRV